MSIDYQKESLLTFSQATKSLPGKPSVSTIHRWRLRGIRGVRLASTMQGGVRYTSHEALQRFFDAITRVADGDQSSCKKGERRCRSSSKQDCKTLDDAGIKE